MSLWRQLAHGARALVRRSASDQDIADEVRDYIERATDAHIARGLAPGAARRAAQLEVGNVTVAREEVRAYGWENGVETVLQDLHYAIRRLKTNRGFTAVGVLTLALGIGAATAIFSVLNPILLAPLPYPHADRLVTFAARDNEGSGFPPTFGNYVELRARERAIESFAVADRWQPSLTESGDPERLEGQRVSASYFSTIGVLPSVGRDFRADEDQPGGSKVVILSQGLLERRFGGDRSIVGRRILLNGDPYVVVGIMPRDFKDAGAPSAEVWAPLQAQQHASFNSREWGHHYRILGRLAPGASMSAAMRETATIGRTPVAEFPRAPWADFKQGMLVRALQDDVTGGVRPALLAIAGAVLLLLAIACVNVTNLLLARGAQRRGELAMRVALGAGRTRLLRQLLTESVVLAAVGGALGLLVAQIGVRSLVAMSPPGLPRADAIRLDGTVFAFALVATTAIGLMIGLVPALAASRASVRDGLQQSSSRAVSGHHGTRSTLVVAEVALALVLLVGAGLLLRSLERLFAVAPGFDPSGLLTMQVVEAGHGYDSDTARLQFFTQALDAVRRVPGVRSAAFTSQLPLSGDVDAYGYESQASSRRGNGNDIAGSALRYEVTPGYFQTMRIPLRRGRYLDSADVTGSAEAIVINESFARRFFAHQDPIGQRLRFGSETMGAHPWDVVVGVVGDVKQQSLATDAGDAFYVSSRQWDWVDNVQSLVVRTTGDAAALVPSIKRAIWSVDKNQPILRVATMDDLVARSAAQQHFVFIILEAFALAALVLAAVGIYGVLAGRVAERTREIGVRAALGASPGEILSLVIRQGLALTVVGAAVGLLGASAATRTLTTLLYGVSRLDPVTYVGVVALLVGAALLSCWAPAWRAARVDPAITLRAE